MNKACISIMSFLVGVIFSCSMISAYKNESVDKMYYQPAEVVAYNETNVFFETPDGNIYHFEIDSESCPDTVPYLLNMDSMGTDDVTDDEIVVVWRCAN